MSLEERYERVCRAASDIRAHLPTLRQLARGCDHVVELGVRGGNSTTALLAGQPRRLTCVDLHHCPVIDELGPLTGRTELRFHLADSRLIDLEPCDLLFIDTWHTYSQLRAELLRHAKTARRQILLHDTETFRHVGEDGGRGLWPAVQELMRGASEGCRWEIGYHNELDNGLTLLERL